MWWIAIGDIDDVAVKQAADDAGLPFFSKLDVTGGESFSTFLDEVETTLGPIDVLVNNAGIMPVGRLVDERVIVNAMLALLATGGSTNHLIHWVAVAHAAGLVIDWNDFAEL